VQCRKTNLKSKHADPAHKQWGNAAKQILNQNMLVLRTSANGQCRKTNLNENMLVLRTSAMPQNKF
jgi:hypothetical protein